jgi:ferric-dicitrate binding protein FerR (iron transport regulator)
MTASLAPIDPQTLAALRAGDEHALERVFLERYPSLLDEARERLDDHDPACAARIVERAHLHVWNERATLDSPGKLDDSLREGMREGVVRERSRRAAAHRLVEHEGGLHRPRATTTAPSPEEAWRHLSARLHPTIADEAIARERSNRSRHETAAHIADVERPRSRTPLVIGLVVGAIAVAALVWSLGQVSPDASLSRSLASPEASPLVSSRGQRARVALEGVDALVLGAESRLVVPPRFDELRGVGLEGTASFVIPDGQRLIVQTDRARVIAGGPSAFAVSARPGEEVLVRVDSGTVSVDAGDQSRDVAAGETVAIAAGAAPRAAPQALSDEMLAWTTDSLVVSERPLRDVLPQIARWYALDLWVADSALLDRPVALRAGLGSSGEVIRALEESANVRIRNVDRRLFITDAPAAAPARPARGRSA